MNARFDPFAEWLEIPPEEQLPHHYRLLGLQIYESDRAKIDAAFRKRFELVKSKAVGRYQEESQQLLNLLAAAKVCLTDPVRKAAYDAQLRIRAYDVQFSTLEHNALLPARANGAPLSTPVYDAQLPPPSYDAPLLPPAALPFESIQVGEPRKEVGRPDYWTTTFLEFRRNPRTFLITGAVLSLGLVVGLSIWMKGAGTPPNSSPSTSRSNVNAKELNTLDSLVPDSNSLFNKAQELPRLPTEPNIYLPPKDPERKGMQAVYKNEFQPPSNKDFLYGSELLRNPSGESGLKGGVIPDWVSLNGYWLLKEKDPFPDEGRYCFWPAAVATAELRQDVSMEPFLSNIELSQLQISFRAKVRSSRSQPPDLAQIIVEFRDAANATVIGSFDLGQHASVNEWKQLADTRRVPVGTRWARVRLISIRRAGNSNDGYFDNLSLIARVWNPALSNIPDALASNNLPAITPIPSTANNNNSSSIPPKIPASSSSTPSDDDREFLATELKRPLFTMAIGKRDSGFKTAREDMSRDFVKVKAKMREDNKKNPLAIKDLLSRMDVEKEIFEDTGLVPMSKEMLKASTEYCRKISVANFNLKTFFEEQIKKVPPEQSERYKLVLDAEKLRQTKPPIVTIWKFNGFEFQLMADGTAFNPQGPYTGKWNKAGSDVQIPWKDKSGRTFATDTCTIDEYGTKISVRNQAGLRFEGNVSSEKPSF